MGEPINTVEDHPRPKSTLAVLLGARQWPNFPSLMHRRERATTDAFVASYRDFKKYLQDPRGLALPTENIKDLFDDDRDSLGICGQIEDFLRDRGREVVAKNQPVIDFLLYFVGHGELHPSHDNRYYLVIRATDEEKLCDTGLDVDSLARVINNSARQFRKYVVIDACLSGTIQYCYEWQSLSKCALLVSSNRRDRSKVPAGERYSMFTGALLEVLRSRNSEDDASLSLRDIRYLSAQLIQRKYCSQSVVPEVHVPDQRHGDIAAVPIFRKWGQPIYQPPHPWRFLPSRRFILGGVGLTFVMMAVLLGYLIYKSRDPTWRELSGEVRLLTLYIDNLEMEKAKAKWLSIQQKYSSEQVQKQLELNGKVKQSLKQLQSAANDVKR